ncbi:MAG: site-specific integrase [Tolypothrix carrinoi HA7290-LM1]|nr:site-specific integrase [Tolypothrix carrinoi HA7290-LM1]
MQITTANSRLKSQNIGLAIERDGGRLRLQGIFPPKPDSDRIGAFQQRLYPDIRATSEGVRLIEKEALKIRLLLDERKFDWEPYLKISVSAPLSVGDWINLFEEDYFNRRRRTPQSETTWRTEYQHVFRHLPQGQELTAKVLQAQILATEPDSKTRKRYCICLGALAKFAKLDFNAKVFAGDYNPRKVTPRDIPTDEQIVEWFYKIDNASWRWVYGMLATFGLRNHEVFRLDLKAFENSHICSVLANTKTGARRVWSFHPEWLSEFNLHEISLPKVNLSSPNANLGHSITQYFYRHKIPFPAYSLRHAWAIRTLEYGLDISLAAQQMGHSLKVHSELYHHWISDRQHQRAFELLLKRSDRPLPPT